jgi:hypothetical protein
MRISAILALLCACAFGQDTLLEGVTVDASTGRPLAGVHVRVLMFNANNNAKAFGAMSDSAGHFSIARIPPGGYFCIGERTGYLTLRKGGSSNVPFPSVTLKSGERVTDYRLELTPRATVSGRVLDEYGDPMQNAQVQISPVSSDAPVAFSMSGGSGQTDDRGEYRLPAGPGNACGSASFRDGRARRRTDASPPSTCLAYYPDATIPDRAAPVDVAGGA